MASTGDSGATVDRPPMPKLIIGLLGVTQMIGWGSTFTPLSIIGTELGRDLALSREVVFGGITVMLLVSALIAPRFGRLVDRAGARPVMVAGSVVAALALVAMAQAQGLATYLIGWTLAGIALPMMLSNAALPGLVQVIGPDARRAITGLMLISGLTSTIFMPLIAWLSGTIGWRATYLVFAALHLFVCAPIHAYIMRRKRTADDPRSPVDRSKSAALDGMLPAPLRRRAFIMLAVWACTEGLITWGLYIQVIDILKALGMSTAGAIGVWALVGPAQATARFLELVFGARYSIYTTALLSAVLTSASFWFILPFGVTAFTATAFALSMGVGHGLFAIARNTLPLTLFGAKEYGSFMGWLMVPQNIVNAAAPIIFAAALERVSPIAGIWIAAAAALGGLVSVLLLNATCRTAG